MNGPLYYSVPCAVKQQHQLHSAAFTAFINRLQGLAAGGVSRGVGGSGSGGGACKNCSAQQDIGQDGGCITKICLELKPGKRLWVGAWSPSDWPFFLLPPSLTGHSHHRFGS